MKVFAVGCIYFGYFVDGASFPKEIADTDAYFEDLKNRLERVENVSAVTVNRESDFSDGSYASIKRSDSKILIPLAYGVHLAFDIYIPFRVQESIHERCDVEIIHVDMIYGYEMPLTFVSYEWPEEEGSAAPSDAIVIVRKYLEKKLEDRKFACGGVGPSPFHADFNIVNTNLNDGFSLVDVSPNRLGYASIELVAPSNSQLLDCVNGTRLDNIMSTFYHLSELRSRAITEQASIVANSRELLEKESPKGALGKLGELIRRPRQVDALNKHVFQEMLIRLDMSSSISEAERSQIIGGETTFDRFFDRFREIAIEQSWEKFADVAKFFEERHQKSLGNLTAILAGVIGGVIGSMIGALATYLLTSGQPTPPPPTPSASHSAPAAVANTAR